MGHICQENLPISIPARSKKVVASTVQVGAFSHLLTAMRGEAYCGHVLKLGSYKVQASIIGRTLRLTTVVAKRSQRSSDNTA